MRRRTLLALTGLSTMSTAGCLGSQDDDPENDDSPDGSGNEESTSENTGGGGESTDELGTPVESQPSFSGDTHDPEGADGEFAVDFNARMYTKLQGEGGQFWEAGDGEAYLLGQFRIENTGDVSVDFQPGNIVANADGEGAEWTVLVDGGRLRTTLEAGDDVNEWQVFTVSGSPEDVEVTVEPLDSASTTVEFDEELEFTFPEV